MLPFVVAFFNYFLLFHLMGDKLLNIIIHLIDNQQIKIKDVIKREINSEIYKVISKNETLIYPMPKISFVEVKEK